METSLPLVQMLTLLYVWQLSIPATKGVGKGGKRYVYTMNK